MRRLFLAAAGLLYAVFLAMDLSFSGNTAPLKFVSILLCLFAALCGTHTEDGRLVALALAFAAAADWFLLAPDGRYATGVLLFCIVQALYCIRLVRWRGYICRPVLVIRLAPFAAFFLVSDRLFSLVLLYFANLACSALNAACFRPATRRSRLFAAGLALLLCCDLCIGAFHLGLFFGFTRIGMWLFYLPSQVLVVLSAEPKGDHS